jgi:hypothetical protein
MNPLISSEPAKITSARSPIIPAATRSAGTWSPLHRQVRRFLALEDAIDVAGRALGLSPKEPAAA